MSASVNYQELYEEFVHLTNTPNRSPPEQRMSSPSSPVEQKFLDLSDIKLEQPDTLDSPLNVLTPPSPIRSPPTLTQQQAIIPVEFMFPEEVPPQGSATSEEDPTAARMCDSSSQIQVSTSTASNVVVSTGSGQLLQSGGMQIENGTSTSSNSNTVNSNGQSFLNGLLPTAMIQQQQVNHNLAPVHGHNLGNAGMDSQQHQQQHHFQQQQSQPHPNMHHPITHSILQGNMQHHHLMDNHHHHLQQMNLQYQQGAHQGQSHHGPAHPNSLGQHHHPLQHHSHHGPQQYNIPFGMNLNANNIGNYSNHQMHPFHPSGHQIPNQQSANSMNANFNSLPHQNCFIQQHAAFMNFPQNSQGLNQLNGQRAPVGWMNGPQTSGPVSNQTAIITTNHNNNFNMAACAPTSNRGSKPMSKSSTSKVQLPTLPDLTNLPGGLDVLWRELPIDAQKLMTAQDIPDTARSRGYFTVCELLVLKRLLQARYQGPVPLNKPVPGPAEPQPPQGSLKKVAGGGVNKPEGPAKKSKRGSNKGKSTKANKANANAVAEKNSAAKEYNGQSNEGTAINSQNDSNSGSIQNCGPEMMQQETDENSPAINNEEIMMTLENMKQDIHTSSVPAVTGVGVGGVVNEAMDSLAANASTTTGQNAYGDNQICSGTDMDDDIIVLPSNNGNDSPRLVINEHVNSSNTGRAVVGTPSEAGLAMLTNATVNINSSVSFGGGECCEVLPEPTEGRFCGPPAPFRTTTLVLKLLQIGVYHVRSFSNVNPNRLRVIFTTQRLTYECYLPVIQPPNTGPPSRKILTIDIGFDQIKMMRFGPDSLLMRVEGAPLLTIAVNPSQEEMSDDFGPHDKFLLEQIEKGQLKLSPIHQLYFLNERLVSSLQTQFRAHPKLCSLLGDGNQLQQ